MRLIFCLLALLLAAPTFAQTDSGGDTVQRFAELAFQYGPFFFAIFFLLIITRWTYSSFKDTFTRKDPLATEEEKTVARRIYYAAFGFGCALVVASLGWWFVHNPNTYVLEGEIKNLASYEKVAADGFYFRAQRKDSIDDSELRNECFAVVQTSPFRKGQVFTIEFAKGTASKRADLSFAYDPKQPRPTFKIEWDDKEQKNRLVKLATTVEAGANRFPGIVYAADTPASSVQSSIQRPIFAANQGVIQVLQNPRSDVGAKIDSLDKLNKLDKTALRAYCKPGAYPEPIIVTLFDLSRHSDKELALKARYVLQKIDVDSLLAEQLKSSDPKTRRSAEEVLYRIEKPAAEKILRTVNANSSPALKEVATTVASGKKQTVLIPTGSERGDRYYVKATWDPKDTAAVQCLNDLFNAEVGTTGLLQGGVEKSKGGNERYVYWYAKDWAISVSNKIVKCGGHAAFDRPASLFTPAQSK